MQELIDYAISKYGSDSDVSNDIVVMAMHLKNKEKELLIDSFDDGQANWDIKCQDFKDGNEYYNKTFKN